MWRRRDPTEVTCIACGEEVPRSSAREYDKHGDRWTREDKQFEHLCKACYQELCHQPRGGLEDRLAHIDTAGSSREQFVERYVELVEAERDRPDSRE
jgi:ribosomal protein S27E